MKEFFKRDKSAVESITGWLEKRYNKRMQREAGLQLLVGNRSHKQGLYLIDKMIEYSGVKRHMGFLTAEVFLYFVILLAAVAGIAGYILSGKLIVSMAVAALAFVMVFLVIYIMSGVYYISLEKNIMTFLNLIDNFNKSEDDIVEIIRKTVGYVDNPLKELLRDFCNDAKLLGDTRAAFENLEGKLEHDKCRELIRNIEVCSRYDSDYAEVIHDCRISMTDYLSIKAERRAIISNGRIEVAILLVSAGIIVMLYAGITNGMWLLLFDTFIGNCILLYCAVVFIVCLVMMVLFDKNGG